jgi:hypothetical protein
MPSRRVLGIGALQVPLDGVAALGGRERPLSVGADRHRPDLVPRIAVKDSWAAVWIQIPYDDQPLPGTGHCPAAVRGETVCVVLSPRGIGCSPRRSVPDVPHEEGAFSARDGQRAVRVEIAAKPTRAVRGNDIDDAGGRQVQRTSLPSRCADRSRGASAAMAQHHARSTSGASRSR